MNNRALEIGRRIRGAREAAALTVTGLAKAAGVARRTLQYSERGSHEPSVHTLYQLAAVLGVHPREFLP